MGRDVESMIRDLAEAGRGAGARGASQKAGRAPAGRGPARRGAGCSTCCLPRTRATSTREKLRGMLRAGGARRSAPSRWTSTSDAAPTCAIFGSQGMEEMGAEPAGDASATFPSERSARSASSPSPRRGGCSRRKRPRSWSIASRWSARRSSAWSRAGSSSSTRSTRSRCRAGGRAMAPTSRASGVQRDLLPIVEGSTVNTKYGPVKTDHVLFIAAGAFHVAKVGRSPPRSCRAAFPSASSWSRSRRATWSASSREPRNALTRQYTALLGAEGVELLFDQSGIEELARVAQEMNARAQNIGARGCTRCWRRSSRTSRSPPRTSRARRCGWTLATCGRSSTACSRTRTSPGTSCRRSAQLRGIARLATALPCPCTWTTPCSSSSQRMRAVSRRLSPQMA